MALCIGRRRAELTLAQAQDGNERDDSHRTTNHDHPFSLPRTVQQGQHTQSAVSRFGLVGDGGSHDYYTKSFENVNSENHKIGRHSYDDRLERQP